MTRLFDAVAATSKNMGELGDCRSNIRFNNNEIVAMEKKAWSPRGRGSIPLCVKADGPFATGS